MASEIIASARPTGRAPALPTSILIPALYIDKTIEDIESYGSRATIIFGWDNTQNMNEKILV